MAKTAKKTPPAKKTIDSDFALLDVKRGRHALLKRVEDGDTRIPVTIEGFIYRNWGGDDGTSIEFEVDVTKVTEHEQGGAKK